MQVLKKGVYNLITISLFQRCLPLLFLFKGAILSLLCCSSFSIFFLLQGCKRKGWLTQIQSYLLILPRSKAFLAFYVLPIGEVKKHSVQACLHFPDTNTGSPELVFHSLSAFSPATALSPPAHPRGCCKRNIAWCRGFC